MTENQKGMTARDLLSRGLAEEQLDQPYPAGADPGERERAASEEANRRRNAERSALGFRALYASGVRELEEPAEAEASAAPSRSPATTEPINPTSEEVRLARDAAMDRLLARTWPGTQGGDREVKWREVAVARESWTAGTR